MSELMDDLGFASGYKETSKEAYKKSSERTSAMKSRILEYLDSVGEDGATDEQMDVHLGTTATRSNRPTRLALCEQGLVRDSKERRKTSSGAKAIVWVLTPEDQIKAQQKRMQTETFRKKVKRRLATLTAEQLKSLDDLITYWETDESDVEDDHDDWSAQELSGYGLDD